jgi:hypothetical protein
MSYRFADSFRKELSEKRRVSCQNKFVKLGHLLGFIKKKFVTMHGHMNVKFVNDPSLYRNLKSKAKQSGLDLW